MHLLTYDSRSSLFNLACARIGAVHSVVFGGFSAESLKDRILDADCSLVITADQSVRGGKKTNLKKNVDTALDSCPGVKNCIVVQRTGEGIEMVAGRTITTQKRLLNMIRLRMCGN